MSFFRYDHMNLLMFYLLKKGLVNFPVYPIRYDQLTYMISFFHLRFLKYHRHYLANRGYFCWLFTSLSQRNMTKSEGSV